jgi:Heterokaryon incompatibility protein (HET)
MGDLPPSPESSVGEFIGSDEAACAQAEPYTALSDDQSIRMLILEPGELTNHLKGRLEIVNIDSAGSYETLSYVWGTSKQVDKISIRHGNSEWSVDLTASLKEALLRLRFPDKQRRLWADQICINQSDVAERSQQVQFMNRIYEHASHVLVWLGPDGSGLAKPAFELVHNLDQLFQDEKELRKFTTAATKDLEEQSRDRWNALDHLTERPWVS